MKEIDPITHGLIGAALSTLSGHPLQLNDPVLLGCALGGMLPDLDIVTHVKGRLNYLLKHRGASHSVLALSGMALGLSTVLYGFFPSTPWTTIFFWTLVGTLSHGITDVLNSYGAELLWPFWRKKITTDMVMLTDPVLCLLFLGTLIFSAKFPDYGATATTTVILSGLLYLVNRELRRRKMREKLMKRYQLKNKGDIKVIPAMYRPFSWNFIINRPELVRFGTVRFGEVKIVQVLPGWDETDPRIKEALGGNLAEIFTQLTPHYHIMVEPVGQDEWEVSFTDLRYWTNEGFLYSGTVTINSKGEISSEIFQLANREGIQVGY